jgi:hypothetical protein
MYDGLSSEEFMDQNRPQTFEDALRILNEATAAESARLKDLLSSDYANLRTAIDDLAPRVTKQVRDTAGPYINQIDRTVRDNPYLVLGGVALGAIALGYLFGRSKTPPPADYTGLSYGDVPPVTAPATSTDAELA